MSLDRENSLGAPVVGPLEGVQAIAPATISPTPWQAAEPFRSFAEQTSDLVTIVDDEGRIRYANQGARRVFGLAPEECIGRLSFEFVHPADLLATRRAFEAWRSSPDQLVLHHVNRQVSVTGEVCDMLWTTTAFHDERKDLRCFVSYAFDVSAALRLERQLAEREARARAQLEGLLDPLLTIDAHGIVREASRSVERVFGYAPDDLIGKNVSMLMPEPYRSEHDEYLARYRATGKTWILNTTRRFSVVRKDGATVECELSVSRIDVPGTTEPLFCGSFRDVSERLRAERALAESEGRYRVLFEQEFQYVGLLDQTGRLIEVNQGARAAIGARSEDLDGLAFWETPWWRGSEERVRRVREAVEAAAQGRFVRFEVGFVALGGEERTIDFSLKPVHDAEGRVTFLIAEGRDITELKSAQRRETSMLRALAEIGESASILAHEIKNPITAINLALRAVSDKLGGDEKAVLEDLVARMQRLEKTMRRTLTFARPLQLHRSPCKARALFEEAAALLREQIERAATVVEIRVEDGCPDVSADDALLVEVLMNLLRNSLEALESGGRIRLSAASDGAGFVRLLVEDDGPGIPESLVPSLFKPFATSKSTGTGLGLALCRKIVEEHGGTVVASNGGALGGATVGLRLPTA